MLTVGDRFPAFRLKAVVSSDLSSAFEELSIEDIEHEWKVVFFYPKDFTFVCPTELVGFGELKGEFEKRDAQILGASTDSEFVHLAWRQSRPDLRDLPFPLLADIRRDLSNELGILEPTEHVCNRATFILDGDNIIRYVNVTAPEVGRNPAEVLRVLDALQSGELTPCNWKRGEATIKVE